MPCPEHVDERSGTRRSGLNIRFRCKLPTSEKCTADRLAYLGTLAGGLAHEIRNPLNVTNQASPV